MSRNDQQPLILSRLANVEYWEMRNLTGWRIQVFPIGHIYEPYDLGVWEMPCLCYVLQQPMNINMIGPGWIIPVRLHTNYHFLSVMPENDKCHIVHVHRMFVEEKSRYGLQ